MSTNKQKLKFAVVGCGHIGKKHIDVIMAEKRAELVAVCDINPDVLAELQKEHKMLSYYDDFDLMLKEADFSIVCICTPHSLHSPMSINAANAGKHILVEKPMSLSSDESEKMIEAAKENQVKLYVVKQNRYNTPILLTDKAIKENRLGRIFMVQCNVMWNRNDEYYKQSLWRGKKASEGGALHTQVSHFLDLMIWWFGDLEQAKTLKDTLNHEIEIEDCGVSAMRFQSGVLGSLFWTTCVYNYNYEGSITIVGEKGTIKIGGKYLNEIEYWDVQSYPFPSDVVFDDKPNSYGSYKGSSSNHDKLMNELVLQIIHGRRGVVEGEEGQKIIKAIEMIYEGSEL